MKSVIEYAGPYLCSTGRLAGRRFMVVKYSDGTKGTTLYSRYLMSQHLGRPLHPHEETVDHINGDKTDDRISNLQILTRSEHSKKDARKPEMVECVCPLCQATFKARAYRVRDNQVKMGKRGPYCSRSCAGKDSRA